MRSDVADFHGRTQLVDELLDHLRRPDSRLLAVVGPSGSGKSSIVRAGLVPALRAGRLPGSSRWFFTSMLPGARPWTLRDEGVVDRHDIAVGYWNDDGSLLATAASDGRITIRHGDTFEPVREMAGPTATLNLGTGGPLVFSADGSLLLTDHDNVARLWDVTSGQQIGVEMTTADGTNSGINTGEKLQLITGTDSSALVWNLDTDSWADVACRAAGSNLSPDEWDQWGPRDEPYRTICEQFAPATPR